MSNVVPFVADTQQSAPQIEIASLMQANRRFYRVFESMKLADMLTLWENSSRVFCVHPGWPAVYGNEAVQDSWERIMGEGSGYRFDTLPVQLSLLGDWGVVNSYEVVYTILEGEPHRSCVVSSNWYYYYGQGIGWKLVQRHASHTSLPPEVVLLEFEGENAISQQSN